MGNAIKSREIRQLRCELADDERQKKAERVAELLQEMADAEAALRSARAHWKSRLEALDAEKERVLHDFRTRTEVRDIECEMQIDFARRVATWIRTDTGEPMWERPLSDQERQQPLFADGGQADGEGEDEGDEVLDGEGEEPETSRGRRRSATGRRRAAKALETGTGAAV